MYPEIKSCGVLVAEAPGFSLAVVLLVILPNREPIFNPPVLVVDLAGLAVVVAVDVAAVAFAELAGAVNNPAQAEYSPVANNQIINAANIRNIYTADFM